MTVKTEMLNFLLPNVVVETGPCAPLVTSSQASTPTHHPVNWETGQNQTSGTASPKPSFPNAGLHYGPAQLPDRRHKHAMALNMEIHGACEMFQL